MIKDYFALDAMGQIATVRKLAKELDKGSYKRKMPSPSDIGYFYNSGQILLRSTGTKFSLDDEALIMTLPRGILRRTSERNNQTLVKIMQSLSEMKLIEN